MTKALARILAEVELLSESERRELCRALAESTPMPRDLTQEEDQAGEYSRNLNQEAAQTPVNPVTFKGKGLSPEFAQEPWAVLRDMAYQGHGA